MPAPTALAEALAALSALFSRRRVRWYLFGAQAVVLHGRPRFTEDIDVTVAVSEAKLPSLIAALGRAGFRARVEDVDAFVERTRVIPLLHRASGVPVDVVIAGSGLEQEFLDRAERVAIGRASVPVIAAGDLVVTKLIAARAKDLDDAESVLVAQRGRIDLRRLRAMARAIDEALGDRDLSGALEVLIKRSRGARS